MNDFKDKNVAFSWYLICF